MSQLRSQGSLEAASEDILDDSTGLDMKEEGRMDSTVAAS